MLFYICANLGFEISYEYLSGWPELTKGEIIPKIKLAKWCLIGLIFPWEIPHPDQYSCALHAQPSATYQFKKYISLKKDLWTIDWSYVNTYKVGEPLKKKIIPLKRCFASLIFGIFYLQPRVEQTCLVKKELCKIISLSNVRLNIFL